MVNYSNKPMTVSEAILFYGKQLYPDKDFNLKDKKRRQMYEDMYLYFKGKETCPYNLKKGILLLGDVGVGKSALFRVYQHIFPGFKIFPAQQLKKILSMYADDKEIKFPEQHVIDLYGKAYKKPLLIDDLGREDHEIYLFKNKISVMEEILGERSDLFIEEGIKTYATSNVDTDTLNRLYGERVFDRCVEMFNVITWEGLSLRK